MKTGRIIAEHMSSGISASATCLCPVWRGSATAGPAAAPRHEWSRNWVKFSLGVAATCPVPGGGYYVTNGHTLSHLPRVVSR